MTERAYCMCSRITNIQIVFSNNARLVNLQKVRLTQIVKFSRFWMYWILCNMTPCSPVEIFNPFRRTCCLHLQGRHLHFGNETWYVGLHTAHSMLTLNVTAELRLWDGCNQNAVSSTWHELYWLCDLGQQLCRDVAFHCRSTDNGR